MIPYIFENSHWLAVDKPHGWLTTPGRDREDPRPCLGLRLQAQVGAPIFPVHRLDFEVGGLVLFALDAEAHRISQGWFEHGQVVKSYHALSGPGPEFADWQEWHSRLAKGKRRAFEAGHGKPAVTRARTLGPRGGLRLWELQPLTGRAHQLRFEMAKHFAPIEGDVLYGGAPSSRAGWIGLRAVRLDFGACEGASSLGLPVSLVAPTFTSV